MRSFKKKHYFIPTKTHEILSCADITGRSSGKKTNITEQALGTKPRLGILHQ
jgi:hypothetical protein